MDKKANMQTCVLCLQPLCSTVVAPPPCSTQQPACFSFSSILNYYCSSLNRLQPYLTPVWKQVVKLMKLKLGAVGGLLFTLVSWMFVSGDNRQIILWVNYEPAASILASILHYVSHRRKISWVSH